jgi:hypothetical protein
MKISLSAITLFTLLIFYSVCCTIGNPVVHKEFAAEKSESIREDRRAEVIRNVKPGHDFLEAADYSKPVFPEDKWTRGNPEAMGWDTDELEKAKEYYENLNADACIIIQNGYIVSAWGDLSKPIECRSLRKSFLNNLIGISHAQGTISLDETLGSMGIDEKGGLTEVEKTATVEHLLSSRSGIFLPAAYDPNDHPDRGIYSPGEKWHYNNWDFNALATVFEKKTGKKIFEAFQSELAVPLQMQDFNPANTKYLYENVSLHPAYLFSTSARDDARMALLWLNKGKWKDRQLIPESWMAESTSLKTDFEGKGGYALRDGYGYLFWIDKDGFGEASGFAALGSSGQYIYVSTKHNFAIVLRSDPGSVFKKWLGMRLDPNDSYHLVNLVIGAAPKVMVP